MPSLAQTLAAVTTTFAAEKHNAKIIPTQIIIDNEAGLAPRVITIQDFFAHDASNGVPVPPAAAAVNRLIITVDNGGWATIAAEALKELEILGRLQVAIDAVTVGNEAIVTISWGFE